MSGDVLGSAVIDGEELPLGVVSMAPMTDNGRPYYAAVGEMVPPGWEYADDRDNVTAWQTRDNPPSPTYGRIYLCRPPLSVEDA